MTNRSDFTAAFASSSAAEAYDEVLVPRLFTPCAEILLSRLGLRPGETLLDVACGTGIVVLLAAPMLGPGGLVIGRDINEAMVVRARSHALPPGSAGVAAVSTAHLLCGSPVGMIREARAGRPIIYPRPP